MSNVISILKFWRINILQLLQKYPQFMTSCMPIHYFSPFISLRFTNQKVTN